MGKTVFFDLETSGLNPQKHEIIQIAAVALNDDFKEIDRFGPLRLKFNIDAASPEALKINHYDAALWEDAISQKQLVGDFSNFLKKHSTVKMISRAGNPYFVAQLAGHNIARFDIPFLLETFVCAGRFCPIRMIGLDTLQLAAWRFFKSDRMPENLRLDTLAEYFGVAFQGEAHDAMADVLANIEIAKLLREEI